MNPSSLERQLLHMDLRKGMNERVRPECGDPSSHLTLVENLIQDQDGAWVKRPGLTQIGGSLTNLSRLVRLRGGGVGAVYDNGKLAAYSENASSFADVVTNINGSGHIPHFVTSADIIVGAQNRYGSGYKSVVSTSKYTYVAYSGESLFGYLAVYDKDSGALVKLYDNTPMVHGGLMTAVADRYVYIFYGDPTGGGRSYCVIVDTNTSYEVNFGTAITLATPGFAAAATPKDTAAGTDRAFALFNGTVYSVTTGGTVTSRALSGLSIAASPDKLWVATITNLLAVNVTNIASTVVASAAHGGSADGFIEVTDSNRVYQTTPNTVTMFTQVLAKVDVRVTTADNGTTFGAATSIIGWHMESFPFYMEESNSVYVQVRKDEPGANSMHAVVNITNGLASGILGSFRCESTLEPFNGIETGGVGGINGGGRYTPYNSNSVTTIVPTRTSVSGLSYVAFNLKTFMYRTCGTALYGEQAMLACGTPTIVGSFAREIGFVDLPVVDAQDSGAAGNPNGAYRYVAVYRQVDESGSVTWSRTSPIEAVTVAGNSIDVSVAAMAVSLRDNCTQASANSDPTVVVDLYRTLSGGTIYYLCASSALGTTVQSMSFASGFWTVTDDYSDATLAASQLLFRQPGTPNGPLDRYPAPPTKILISHKDRLYATGPNGSVYYSSFFVDGEGPWFHPQFGFFVHGGSGPITGLASMDGRLVVFKRDGVFLVDGDGPAEGGVAGNEFSPPQRVATEYGCVDHRSIQVFSGGILYRSARGIELLTRGFDLKFIGDRIYRTADAYPYTVASAIDNDGHYRILVSATDSGTRLVSGNGRELVYDIINDCWSVGSYLSGAALQDCLVGSLLADDTVVYAASGAAYRADASSGLDGTTYVTWTVESGWIRTGQQARQRIERFLFLGKKSDNHKITVDAAYNYVDSYTDTETWEPDVLNAMAIEEVVKNTVTNQVLAAKFKVTEEAPTDTTSYPVTTGKGCDILGLTVKIAVKTGDPKVAAEAKG